MKAINKKINNIPVTIFNEDKFKTITIRLSFLNSFSKENAARYSLLTSLLTNTCKKYNTKKKVTNILKELYGANISVSTYGIYKTRITNVTLTIVNGKYLDEEKLTIKGINLLKEFILNPNVTDGAFDEKNFLEEKRNIQNSIIKRYNNKNRYALRQAINKMCPDEIVGVSSDGNLEDYDTITPQMIYETYLDMINNSQKFVYVIGDVDKRIVSKLKFLKALESNDIVLEGVLQDSKIVEETKVVKENMKVSQAILVLGYRTTIANNDQDYEALQLFNSMFGGMFTSSLFQVIREQNSLAYSIYTSLLGDAKIMICNAGIDKNEFNKTLDLINQELNKYKDGKIDINLLKMAKSSNITELNEIEDNPRQFLSLLGEYRLLGLPLDLEKTKKRINKVKKADIIRVAQTIKLDMVYMLADGE